MPLTLTGLALVWVGAAVLRLALLVSSASWVTFASGAISLLAGGGAIVIGLALRSFRPWARKPAIWISALILILLVARLLRSAAFDAGLVALLALAVLPLAVLSLPRSAYVFTREYEMVRACTPHLRYRAPLGVWGPLAALIAILAAWIGYVLLS